MTVWLPANKHSTVCKDRFMTSSDWTAGKTDKAVGKTSWPKTVISLLPETKVGKTNIVGAIGFSSMITNFQSCILVIFPDQSLVDRDCLGIRTENLDYLDLPKWNIFCHLWNLPQLWTAFENLILWKCFLLNYLIPVLWLLRFTIFTFPHNPSP